MARQSAARRFVHWHDYHPELGDVPKPRPAKVHDLSPRSVRQTMQETAAPEPTVLPASFESPESSTIAAAEYDMSTATLSVMFKRARGLDRYDYTQIPPELWAEFYAAESKGQFFSARIRPLYEGRKITR